MPGITALFDTPYFTGGTTSTAIPFSWPVAINGRNYMLDEQPITAFSRWQIETIPLLKQQFDSNKVSAESSINPQGFWRRGQDSFHHGAGQTYRDRDDAADQYRFRTSKGLDPWTRYEMNLLPDTEQKKSSAELKVLLAVAGDRLYLAMGAAVWYTLDVTAMAPTWTSVTYGGVAVTSLCSDGYNVYAVDGANIWVTNTSVATFGAAADSTDADVCAYVKARFMSSKAYTLQNIVTMAGAFGGGNGNTQASVLNRAFSFTCFAEGPAFIYAGGFSGDKSLVYKIAIQDDGTVLDAPIIAGELPNGELLYGMQGYLGFLFLGTSRGIRAASINTDGSITIGAVIETPSPVRCFNAHDRFVWFAYSDYDDTSTGLGRIDVTEFTNADALVFAYASDLMVTGTGDITSIVTFQDLTIFGVAGLGVYGETTDKVATATLETGKITFELPDPKVAISLRADTTPLAGSYDLELAGSDGVYRPLGTKSDLTSTNSSFPCGNLTSERFEARFTFHGSTTEGPTLLRWTLKTIPTLSDGFAELFHLPLLLSTELEVKGGVWHMDVAEEREIFSALRASRRVIPMQYMGKAYSGVVTDFQWFGTALTDDRAGGYGEEGTLLIDFQRIV